MTIQIIAPEDGEIGKLTTREVELPQPGPQQIRIAVRAAGVNPSDWKTVYQTWPHAEPMVVGGEAAGVVTALGSDVEAEGRIALGDAVVACPIAGSYASEVLCPAENVFPKPDPLDFGQAANLLIAGTTAAEMLEVTRVRDDTTIVVHGASGAVGVSLLQQAARIGARVIGTASERNFDLLRSFGAEPVPCGPGLLQRLRTAAPGGVDAALDCVGTGEAMAVSLRLVADRARIATISNAELAQELGIRFLTGNDPKSLEFRMAARHRLLEMAAAGRLTVPLARTLPLTAAEEAFSILRSEHPGGKLALIP